MAFDRGHGPAVSLRGARKLPFLAPKTIFWQCLGFFSIGLHVSHGATQCGLVRRSESPSERVYDGGVGIEM